VNYSDRKSWVNKEGRLSTKETVEEIIYDAIDEVNNFIPQERKLTKSLDTILSVPYSEQSLDSLGMVNLIVAIEQKIQENLNVSVSLADELFISDESNPFERIATLIDGIVDLLDCRVSEK